MLKIRDNVDLNELKKFGFIEYQCLDDAEWYYCFCDLFIGKNKLIQQDDGINCCIPTDYKLSEYETDIIFDLIQAGLVEKVGE